MSEKFPYNPETVLGELITAREETERKAREEAAQLEAARAEAARAEAERQAQEAHQAHRDAHLKTMTAVDHPNLKVARNSVKDFQKLRTGLEYMDGRTGTNREQHPLLGVNGNELAWTQLTAPEQYLKRTNKEAAEILAPHETRYGKQTMMELAKTIAEATFNDDRTTIEDAKPFLEQKMRAYADDLIAKGASPTVKVDLKGGLNRENVLHKDPRASQEVDSEAPEEISRYEAVERMVEAAQGRHIAKLAKAEAMAKGSSVETVPEPPEPKKGETSEPVEPLTDGSDTDPKEPISAEPASAEVEASPEPDAPEIDHAAGGAESKAAEQATSDPATPEADAPLVDTKTGEKLNRDEIKVEILDYLKANWPVGQGVEGPYLLKNLNRLTGKDIDPQGFKELVLEMVKEGALRMGVSKHASSIMLFGLSEADEAHRDAGDAPEDHSTDESDRDEDEGNRDADDADKSNDEPDVDDDTQSTPQDDSKEKPKTTRQRVGKRLSRLLKRVWEPDEGGKPVRPRKFSRKWIQSLGYTHEKNFERYNQWADSDEDKAHTLADIALVGLQPRHKEMLARQQELRAQDNRLHELLKKDIEKDPSLTAQQKKEMEERVDGLYKSTGADDGKFTKVAKRKLKKRTTRLISEMSHIDDEEARASAAA